MKNGRHFWCGCASCSLVAIIVCAISVSVFYKSQDRIYFKTPATSSSGYEQKYFSASTTSQEVVSKSEDPRRPPTYPNKNQAAMKFPGSTYTLDDTDVANEDEGDRDKSPAEPSAEKRWERRHSAAPPAVSPPETMYFGRKAAPVYETALGPDKKFKPVSSNTRWPLPPDSREIFAKQVEADPAGAAALLATRIRREVMKVLKSVEISKGDGTASVQRMESRSSELAGQRAGHRSTFAEREEKTPLEMKDDGSGVFGIPGMKVRAEYQSKGGRKFFSITGSDSPAPLPEIVEKIADEIEQIKRARANSPPGMGLITHANLNQTMDEDQTRVKRSSHRQQDAKRKRMIRSADNAPTPAPPNEETANYEGKDVTQVMDGKGEQDAQPEMKKAIEKLLSSMSATGLSRFDVHFLENVPNDGPAVAYKPAEFPVELSPPKDETDSPHIDEKLGNAANKMPLPFPTTDTDVFEFETQNARPPTDKSDRVRDEEGRREFVEEYSERGSGDEGYNKSGALRAAPSTADALASFIRRMSPTESGRRNFQGHGRVNKPPLARRPEIFEQMSLGSTNDRAGDGLLGSRVMTADDVIRMLSKGKNGLLMSPHTVERSAVLAPGTVLARSAFDPELKMYLPMKRRSVADSEVHVGAQERNDVNLGKTPAENLIHGSVLIAAPGQP